jgi:hypothetical protein
MNPENFQLGNTKLYSVVLRPLDYLPLHTMILLESAYTESKISLWQQGG